MKYVFLLIVSFLFFSCSNITTYNSTQEVLNLYLSHKIPEENFKILLDMPLDKTIQVYVYKIDSDEPPSNLINIANIMFKYVFGKNLDDNDENTFINLYFGSWKRFNQLYNNYKYNSLLHPSKWVILKNCKECYTKYDIFGSKKKAMSYIFFSSNDNTSILLFEIIVVANTDYINEISKRIDNKFFEY